MLRTAGFVMASLISFSTFSLALASELGNIKPSDVQSVGFVKQANIIAVESGDCGDNPGCDAMTTVTVNLSLGACIANLGDVSYRLSKQGDGSIKITMSAITIISKESMLVRCKMLAHENYEIRLRGSHDQFVLDLM